MESVQTGRSKEGLQQCPPIRRPTELFLPLDFVLHDHIDSSMGCRNPVWMS